MCHSLLVETHADTKIQHKPNKKYYDPRKWVREGEETMKKRVMQALEDFKTEDKVSMPSA